MITTYKNTPFNILLADDDNDDCLFFTEALGKLPFKTHLQCASHGERLLEILCDTANKLPNIIFLNLRMPRKSGLECLTEIKLNER
ncbi:hypothetical protein BH09BAC1_BH09BAC1_16060 [soil metagenome]